MAAQAQAAAAAAQALINANQQVEQSRLPLWTSVKESAFTAEQWIERITRARQAGNWNDNVTMSYVFNALRGDALTFFDALPTLGYRQNNFDDFKEAFIKTYGTTRTVRTAALNLTDLRQGGSEPASRYIARVIKVVADIQAMAPPILPQPAAPWTADVLAVAGFGALAQAAKNAQAQLLISHGAQDAYHRIGMQLFIAGLRPILRVELMKTNPQTMREAFDAVIDAEKIVSEPLKFGQKSSIMAVATETEEEEIGGQTEGEQGEEDAIDAEIAALSAKLKSSKREAKPNQTKATKEDKSKLKTPAERKQVATMVRAAQSQVHADTANRRDIFNKSVMHAKTRAHQWWMQTVNPSGLGGCMRCTATDHNSSSSNNSSNTTSTTTHLHIIRTQTSKLGG